MRQQILWSWDPYLDFKCFAPVFDCVNGKCIDYDMLGREMMDVRIVKVHIKIYPVCISISNWFERNTWSTPQCRFFCNFYLLHEFLNIQMVINMRKTTCCCCCLLWWWLFFLLSRQRNWGLSNKTSMVNHYYNEIKINLSFNKHLSVQLPNKVGTKVQRKGHTENVILFWVCKQQKHFPNEIFFLHGPQTACMSHIRILIGSVGSRVDRFLLSSVTRARRN